MIDIFSKEFAASTEERAGGLLAQKDLKEERHDLKKTDEEVFKDFLHNVSHPFMHVLREEARAYAETGEPFVVWNRINVMIDDRDSDAFTLYYNGGDTWRRSGNALIAKYLKELYPNLYIPRMQFGCKGEQLLLDAYPDNFQWVRDEYKRRANKAKGGAKNEA